MKNNKDYMERDKFFYASPKIFPNWPYKSRLGIGLSLRDFWALKKPVYNFLVKKDLNNLYSIASYKARVLGQIYKMPYGSLPNIIPLQEFKKIPLGKPVEDPGIPQQIGLL